MSVTLQIGTVVADRFRLLRPLGQGGMGALWVAHHTGLDIPCVLKFILGDAANNPEMRARFEREAKAAAQIRSPHVVQTLDHGIWQGLPYIAMELLEGEDLASRLAKRGRLSPHETAEIISQVARALSKAHASGLVHRDLKPANIYLCRDDDREIVKVLDFGIARVTTHGVNSADTKTGMLLGTPFYMSPEQARALKTVDHRSDLWSLAVVVFQCLTGRLPFMSDALADLFMRIIVEPLPIPSQIAPVPPGFDAWWARACARDPAHRYQSAKEFAESLVAALAVSAPVGMGAGAYAPPPIGSAPGPLGGGPLPAAPLNLNPGAPASTGGAIASSISVARAPKSGGRSAAVWIGIAAAAFGVGAVGTFFLIRGASTPISATAGPPVSAVVSPEPSMTPQTSKATLTAPAPVEPPASAAPAAPASGAPTVTASAAPPASAAPTARPATPAVKTAPVKGSKPNSHPSPQGPDFGI